jgi:hypothetical protein
VLADLRYGVRLLGRAPAFALAATATIALAVAGIVAIVSVIYGLLFRPLLVPGANRVMVIRIVDSRFPGHRLRVLPERADLGGRTTAAPATVPEELELEREMEYFVEPEEAFTKSNRSNGRRKPKARKSLHSFSWIP